MSNFTLMSPALEPIKVLAMVLQEEMNIITGQIMLGLENYVIPKNQGLYVALLYGSEQTIGNNQYNSLDAQGNYIELMDTVILHTIDIEVMSFNSEARTRKEEVLQAITSYYSQSLMEQYSMKLNSTPGSFIPIRDPEPSKQLNRFTVSVNMNVLYKKAKVTPYYDTLQTVQLIEAQ